jgi:hypothetical protein
LHGDAAGHATACHRTAELPPPDALEADSAVSSSLERLVAAFSKPAEGPASAGVDMVRTKPSTGI